MTDLVAFFMSKMYYMPWYEVLLRLRHAAVTASRKHSGGGFGAAESPVRPGGSRASGGKLLLEHAVKCCCVTQC